MRIILCMLMLVLASGCGQSGKLYLPHQPSPELPDTSEQDYGEKVG